MQTAHKAIITGILLALSLMTALLLESRITSGVKYQLVFIFLGILVSAAIVFGLIMQRAWAYPLGIVVFVLSLANILWLFVASRSLLGFAFGILVNVIGLVICLLNLETGHVEPYHDDYTSPVNLETYDISGQPMTAPKRGRGRPPKNQQVYSNF